ncbi:MAG: hypothetical protein MUC40_07675 [Akkermansiaceae bacterium]|nr:hypothetical protein [Akkermansiaceae bacterium]
MHGKKGRRAAGHFIRPRGIKRGADRLAQRVFIMRGDAAISGNETLRERLEVLHVRPENDRLARQDGLGGVGFCPPLAWKLLPMITASA